MKCTILHETRGRMRVRTMQGAMSLRQADILEAYLRKIQGVTKATVYDRTGDAVICYDAPRTAIIQHRLLMPTNKRSLRSIAAAP